MTQFMAKDMCRNWMPSERFEDIELQPAGLQAPVRGINLLETGTRGTSRAQDPDSGILAR